MYLLDQPNYYNMVVEIGTNLDPLNLLKVIKEIEVKCGRVKNDIKNMPRELDIDILSIDDLIIETNVLSIPHVKISERLFVLRPWNDIAPNFVIPIIDKTVANLLKENKSDSSLRMLLIVDNK